MLGASLHARSPVFWRPSTGASALPSITHLVIDGDSITSTSPSAPNGAYSYQYAASRPDRTIDVRAQASRVVGLAADLDDDGNSLMGNVAEDLAFGPQLLTAMIGANDLAAARTAAQYKGDLIAYNAALKAAGVGCRFAWSPPLPYNPTGTPHPSYANFTAQRAAVMADARDPAVWGQWADYYLPLASSRTSPIPALPRRCSGTASIPRPPVRRCCSRSTRRRSTASSTRAAPVRRGCTTPPGRWQRPTSPLPPLSSGGSSSRG